MDSSASCKHSWQQDGVFVGLSRNKRHCVSYVNKRICYPVQQFGSVMCVFGFGHQWSFLAQRRNILGSRYKHNTCCKTCIIGLGVLIGFVSNKRLNAESIYILLSFVVNVSKQLEVCHHWPLWACNTRSWRLRSLVMCLINEHLG